MSSPLEHATRCFQRAVAADPRAHRERVQSVLEVAGLGRLPVLLGPTLFPASDRRWIERVIRLVTEAFERVGELYFGAGRLPDGRDLHQFAPLSVRASTLAAIDGQRAPRLFISRYDAAYDPALGTFQLLEVNAGDPSGLAYNDVCLGALLESPAGRALTQRFDLCAAMLLPLHRGVVLDAVRGRGAARRAPTLAFAVARESSVLDDHQAMLAAALADEVDALLGDPRDFRFDGDVLSLEGRRVDAVYRDTIDEYALDPYWDDVQPLVEALRAGRVALRNPFCTAFADFKGLLEILSDEACASLFNAAQREVLARHIPWTRLVREARTEFEGRSVDLPSFVRDHQEQLVLKPNEGYGGFGVLIGRETAPAAWAARLDEAIAEPGRDVVQRYLPLPRISFPDADGELAPRQTVASFWQFGDVVDGAFARASDDSVINVHQGGGFGPVIWI